MGPLAVDLCPSRRSTAFEYRPCCKNKYQISIASKCLTGPFLYTLCAPDLAYQRLKFQWQVQGPGKAGKFFLARWVGNGLMGGFVYVIFLNLARKLWWSEGWLSPNLLPSALLQLFSFAAQSHQQLHTAQHSRTVLWYTHLNLWLYSSLCKIWGQGNLNLEGNPNLVKLHMHVKSMPMIPASHRWHDAEKIRLWWQEGCLKVSWTLELVILE